MTVSPPPTPRPRLRALLDSFGAFATLSRTARLFLVITGFRGMVFAVSQTVFNLYLYSLGYDARAIGLINAVNSVAVLLVSVPAGVLADRFGRRAVLFVGAAGYPLTILGLALSRTTALLLAFNFLFGAFAVAYWVAGVPLLYANTQPRERVYAFSLNSFLLWGVGPLGALFGGQMVEVAARVLGVSANSTTALRAGMFLLVAFAAAGSIPYPWLQDRPTPPSAGPEAPPRGHVGGLAVRLLAPDLVLAFGLGAVLTFAQLFFHLRFGLDPGPVGIALSVGGVAAGIASLCTPLLAARWGTLRTAVRSQWAAAPMIAVMAISHQLWLGLPAYWLLLMLRGLSDPVYTAFVQERVPEVYRARLTSLYSVTYSIGYSLGPAASGALQRQGGFTPAFLLGAGCYFAGATLLFLFFGRERPSVPLAGDR